MRLRVPRSRLARALVVPIPLVVAVVLFLFHGPSWRLVVDAFSVVDWSWIVAAISFNLLSVVARVAAWRTVIHQAMPPPHPSSRSIFSAFSIGLLANAVLPGRIGELARVAVLTQKVRPRGGAWATLVGTVFAHRVFDLIPVAMLGVFVLLTAKLPGWALTSVVAFIVLAFAAIAFAVASARRHHRSTLEELGAVRRLVTMARHGLGVMRAPVAAAAAVVFQCFGWLLQLLAVWGVMQAFRIHEGLAAAGLVLVLMNVVMFLPLWPGNVGLLQAAIALPLVSYGVAYPHGVAFGIGLQAVEASVGVGLGLAFLAREGLSFAMLKHMPDATQAEVPAEERAADIVEADVERPRARVPL
jgi:uncharacterized protein (TIRG00374 family)